MTIDEAIAHEKRISKDNKVHNFENIVNYHKQIAEWLEALKDYRDKNKMVVRIDIENMDSVKDKIDELSKYAENQYNKAIDDFERIMCEKLKDYIGHKDYMCVGLSLHKFTRDLAEQLKAGGENE